MVFEFGVLVFEVGGGGEGHLALLFLSDGF